MPKNRGGATIPELLARAGRWEELAANAPRRLWLSHLRRPKPSRDLQRLLVAHPIAAVAATAYAAISVIAAHRFAA